MKLTKIQIHQKNTTQIEPGQESYFVTFMLQMLDNNII